MERPDETAARPSGMRAFGVVWFGQMVSLLGTGMAQFALTIWAWEVTGRATALALVGFFNFAPMIAVTPFAGALVDRWNRRLTMMLSDLLAGVATAGVLILFLMGRLEIWHLYVAGLVTGVGQAFQWPAYSAAISTMLRKEDYARANGLLSVAEAGSGILAPLLAGALLGLIGIAGVLVLDLLTFLVAIGALLVVHIPSPRRTAVGQAARGGLLREAFYGFRYIWERRPLLGLQMVFFAMNLVGSLGFTLLPAMILARTGNDELTLGAVQSAGAVGGLVGGLLLGAWGGPKRRVHGVLLGMACASLFGEVLFGLGRSLAVWAAASFSASFFVSILNGSNQAIWQAKVAPDVQGRVFATRRLIAQVTAPLGMLAAGPLADLVFEPAMQPGGALAPWLGGLVGVGPGAGMALLFVLAGALGLAVSLGAYAVPAVREVEALIPDHEGALEPVAA